MPFIQRQWVDPAKSIYFSQRQRGWHHDAANQDANNGHIL